jgi:6-phosphogluconolactonase/glucosamine-6-phosphate isomerase/deaminase
MTLTYRALDEARCVLFLVAGRNKAPALRKLLARDPSIPAARIHAADQRAIVDQAALPDGAPAR